MILTRPGAERAGSIAIECNPEIFRAVKFRAGTHDVCVLRKNSEMLKLSSIGSCSLGDR